MRMSLILLALLATLAPTPALATRSATPAAAAAAKAIATAQMKSFAAESALPPESDHAFYLLYGDPFTSWAEIDRGWHEATIDKRKLEGLTVTPSADGNAAWISFVISFRAQYPGSKAFPLRLRVTELIVLDAGAWKVLAGQASLGLDDTSVHQEAQAAKLDGHSLPAADDLPAELAPVAAALRGGTLADLVDDRPDFITVGSAPKEVTKGKKVFAKAWRAWGTSVKVASGVRGGLAPGGATGWIAVSLTVHKRKDEQEYDIPFQLFLVVSAESGSWKIVQAHLAVPFGSDE